MRMHNTFTLQFTLCKQTLTLTLLDPFSQSNLTISTILRHLLHTRSPKLSYCTMFKMTRIAGKTRGPTCRPAVDQLHKAGMNIPAAYQVYRTWSPDDMNRLKPPPSYRRDAFLL